VRFTLIFAIGAAVLCDGCASRRTAVSQNTASAPTTQISIGPSTRPLDAKANLRLSEIQPEPKLPAPATQPATTEPYRPPLDALDHLRLGLQTKQYADDEAAAAIADYFLAKALQQQGYDRAALEQYEKLLDRLTRRTLALRSDAELSDWSARPQALFSDVARL